MFEGIYQTIFWLDQYHQMGCYSNFLKARKYNSPFVYIDSLNYLLALVNATVFYDTSAV